MPKPKWTFTEKTKPQFCPRCFHLLDAFTCMTGQHYPEPGDYTVCIGCAAVLRWDEAMNFELAELIQVPIAVRLEFVKIINAVKETRKDWSSKNAASSQ